MSHTHTATRTSAVPAGTERPRGRALNIALWLLQALLGLAFASAGVLKLGGAAVMVDLFTEIGAGQWFRYLVGALEVAGAIGVLISLLSGVAALGLTGLMVGATLTNVFIIDESPVVPIAYLLLAVLVSWGRWPRTRALVGRYAESTRRAER